MIQEDTLKNELALLDQAVSKLAEGFRTLPPLESQYDWDSIQSAVLQAAERMQDNYPYGHALYAGQMLKPPHPVARVAYQMAMWVNPNNHALDGGKASSALEKEVVADIASMFGLRQHLGHLTSSGTLANLESLWIAGREHPDKRIVASAEAHYTHSRICDVLGLAFSPIETASDGRVSLDALEALLQAGDVGTIVATLGTTGFGAVDPLDSILKLARHYGARVHVDTAYGGYFMLCDNLSVQARNAYDYIDRVDSIAIDPHKHGLQPYGCGCVLFTDPTVGRHYQHDSPYTYFSSDELHLGEISLECSRAGASAVALWATHQALPLEREGEFADSLSDCRSASLELATFVDSQDDLHLVAEPMLDIVVWAMASSEGFSASELARRTFRFAEEEQLYLAVIEVDNQRLPESLRNDSGETVTCLRSCLMKPEHLTCMPEILHRLQLAQNRAREIDA